MSYNIAFAALILSALCGGAHLATPDLNPDLGQYQDETDCFPFKSNLHQIYRNFKSDPYFGGDAKCVRTGPTPPLVDSQFNTTFNYGENGALEVTIRVMSSPGYTAKNILNIMPLNSAQAPFNFTVAYRDCQRCKVFRHSYINNGAGCSYWLTDEALGDEKTCCEFIYDLLCGTSEKYTIYDSTCSA
ncbi:uncharacterized protein LOC144144936 [Haemaphysalis longicornis]